MDLVGVSETSLMLLIVIQIRRSFAGERAGWGSFATAVSEFLFCSSSRRRERGILSTDSARMALYAK